ncbi:hypothetical protein BD779DRAFT_1621802 [Infundibulicybe gibba]|nr:hypothetical protein BD779DRAFT_1621802 [Infundibulicybe gibba]
MSTGQAQPAQQQQQQQVRKPPFANWPTIKILMPPQGRFSKKTDEWCFTYCSQNVNGRIYGKEPSCRSICIRKVFPHEVRNVVAFKSHRDVGPDGKAKYPLPAEGQPLNLPRYLGGKPLEDSDEQPKPSNEARKYWQEGWYFWTSNSRWAVHDKTDTMIMDLEQQQQFATYQEQRREVWQDYQDHLQQTAGTNATGNQAESEAGSSKWWGPIVPLRPPPDVSSQSLLVPLPPEFPPFWDRINKLLSPSRQVLGILQESVRSGEQQKFAQRVWEKAWSNEPFLLASRTFSRAYERWKDKDGPPDEEDGKRGST